MPKINNQAVVQKLIDELGLYPGVDQIPTELAEKILPTFQVNSQEITMTVKPANVVEMVTGHLLAGGNTTIYTVPATGNFYLTNASLSWMVDTAFGGEGDFAIKVTINGEAKSILCSALVHDIAGSSDSQIINLQNPILIDKGSSIVLDVDGALADGGSQWSAGIVGYTSD